MPLQTRPSDTFTRDNLFLGLPQVEFTPTGGTTVQLGILSAASIQKTLDVLQLEKRDSGMVTIDREIVSRLESALEVETFNFRSDVAQLAFGSSIITNIIADAAAAITDEEVVLPLDNPSAFIPLVNGRLDETPANITAAAKPIVDELVGYGDGVLGTTDGDFTLAYKVAALGDVTRLQEINSSTGAVVRTFTPQAGEPAGATEAQLAVGATATSGQLDLFQAVAVGNELRADYTPSFTWEDDLAAANTDLVLDPLQGRVRFPNAGAATGKLKAGQTVLLDYVYERLAGVYLNPFTRPQVEGSAIIRYLPDVGSNFIWPIPSVTLRITDDDLTFGTDNFATAILRMSLNDDAVNRFGQMQLSSETQANA